MYTEIDAEVDSWIEAALSDDTFIPDDLLEFAPRYLYIQDKDDQIVPFIPKPAQVDFYRKIQESDSRFHLLVKARQMGFSTLIQAWQFHEVCIRPLRAVTMAHDSDTTSKLRQMAKIYYDHLPDGLNVQRITDNAAITRYSPHQSEITIATAGGDRTKRSGGKGRGGTYNFFHGSEVPYWPSPEKTIAGALQGLAGNGLCIFEATANGAQGWVWETVNNPGKWVVHFYPWYWEPEYRLPIDEPLEYTEEEHQLIQQAAAQGFELTDEHIAWRRDKQSELGLMFPQEYPETLQGAFLTSGNSVFGDVSHALYPDLECEREAYNPEHRYVAGMDWGQDHDYTTCSIIDTTTDTEVELLRMNRMGWDVMQERIVDACIRWHVEAIQPERNSIGSVNIHDINRLFEANDYSITIRPITMTNKKKHKLVSNFYRGLHTDGLKLLDNEHGTSELMTFIQKQTATGLYQYAATEGAHDDTVIARLLAWDAASKIIG